MLPRENFKFKSSEMAINAPKTANSNINLQLLHQHLKQQVTTTLDQNFNEQTLKLHQAQATVGCHPDIFKLYSPKVPKLPFRSSLRATNSLAYVQPHPPPDEGKTLSPFFLLRGEGADQRVFPSSGGGCGYTQSINSLARQDKVCLFSVRGCSVLSDY